MSPFRLFHLFLLATASLLIVSVVLPSASWAIDFQPPSPDEMRMTSEPKAPGATAVILFREVDRDDNELSAYEDEYVRVKILTEEGRKYADVEIPYWKGNLKITKFHARTVKPDGSIVMFEGKPIDKTIVKAHGAKILAKTFTMPDVTVGSIIEYMYRIEYSGDYVFDSHWIVSDELFTKNAKFSLKPAAHFQLKVHWNGLPPDLRPLQEKRDIHLDAHDIPAFVVEDFMPPENEMKARVDFTYTRSTETDSNKFWESFGKDCESYLDAYIDKRKAMEQAVGEIVSPNDSTEVKLEKIYARVQQIRNISFEEEKTAQEEKRNKDKWPKNVEEVWKLQHGTSVQLNWLYLALVRAAGIEASDVWVSDRSSYFFDAKMMDGNRLDSDVVLVKLDGHDLYLDPGSPFISFGMLPWSETSVSGYKVDKDGGSWVTTTLPKSSQSLIERKARLKLTDAGDLEGTLTVTFTGLECSRRRAEERFADDAARKKYLEDDVKESVSAASEVELTSAPDWKNSSSSMVATFTLKVPGWASAAGRRSILPVGLFCATEKHLFEHAERAHPIYFQFPSERKDDVTVDLPAGWHILNMPAPQAIDERVALYAIQTANENGTLKLHRTLAMDLLLLDAKSYPALRTFFQTVRAFDEQQVLLQPSSDSAGN
ncbi:MAG: DUF3857 domain-containing protein [Terriglobales bacterium]